MMALIGHVLINLYLVIAAYIDYKTKNVYRIGSYLLIALSTMMFLGSGGSLSSPLFLERLVSILLMTMIIVLQGKAKMMGWGDVFTYVGVFIYIASWKYEGLALELMVVYMLLANVLFLVLNIRNFDWKSRKFKQEAAFLPAMAAAMGIMLLGVNIG